MASGNAPMFYHLLANPAKGNCFLHTAPLFLVVDLPAGVRSLCWVRLLGVGYAGDEPESAGRYVSVD